MLSLSSNDLTPCDPCDAIIIASLVLFFISSDYEWVNTEQGVNY